MFTRTNAYILILVLALYGILYQFWDLKLALYLHQAVGVNSFLYQTSNFVGKIFTTSYWVILAGLCLCIAITVWLRNHAAKAYPWLLFALSVLLSLCIAFAFKVILGRWRPAGYFASGHYGFSYFALSHIRTGSPSGHATAAFAGFAALARIIRGRTAWTLCLALATLIALSRVVITAHYLSDVVLGGYIGLLSSYFVSYFFHLRFNFQ